MQFNKFIGSELGGSKNGYLYNWYSVNTGKLAPTGWHVPTDAEWTTLENYLITNGYNYDNTTSGNKIAKSLASITSWSSNSNTGVVGNTDYPSKRNVTGFSVLPSGQRTRYNSGFAYAGVTSNFLTSTAQSAPYVYTRSLNYNQVLTTRDYWEKSDGFSVRCIRDTSLQGATVTDLDGNLYTSVTIGTQTWMIQNLATTKYNDGTTIPNVTDWTTWNGLTTGAYCSYNNDESIVFVTPTKSLDYINSTTHSTTDVDMTYSNNQAVFNGTTSKITISNSSDLSFTNGTKDLPFSIDIRFTKLGGTNSFGLIDRYDGTHDCYNIYVGNGLSGDIYIHFILYDINGTTIQIYYSLIPVIGVSYRLTCTYDGSKTVGGMKMYLNGIIVTTIPGGNIILGLPNVSAPITIGDLYNGSFGTQFKLNGSIDYCTLYNRVLIQDEIVNGIQNTYDTVTDIDGNVYNTVTIGGQTWMRENLRTTHYRDGSSVTNYQYPSMGSIYGKLYDRSAAQDVRNIAPIGWHLPSLTEWNTLLSTVGNSANKLKSKTYYSGTDNYNFNVLGGGFYNGDYQWIDYFGWFWTSTTDTDIQFNPTDSVVVQNGNSSVAFSIRCIKD